ncbi:MAG: MOP flippase family protein [Candidatus Aquicultor sp.]
MSLKKQAVSGVKWTGTSTAVITVLRFLQLAILTRLLSPQDFGLMAMIMVVIGFTQAFVDMGISNAVIQRQDSTREQLSSLYWLNIISGIVVFGLVVAATPLVVGFYREPRLSGLVVWVALTFVIAPVGQQFQALLQKELRFGKLAGIETAAAVAGAVVAIVSAILKQGVFSLIWGQLATAAVTAVLLAKLGWGAWRPSLRFRLGDIKGYISFGLYQMGERSVNYLSANVDYLMIGRFLGPEILGFYRLAYELVVVPLMRINPVVTRVAFPILAKRQGDDGALRQGYLQMIKLLSIVTFPLLIGLAATAPLIVPVMFGKGWGPSVILVQILVPLGMIKVLGNPSGPVLLAKGRADIGFKWNLFVAVVNTLVFWFFVRYGAYAVAWSHVALTSVYSVFMWFILYRVIKISWQEYIGVLFRPVLMGILMGAVVYVGYLVLSGLIVSELSLLAGLVLCGVLVYGSLMVFFERNYFWQMWTQVFDRKKGIL